VAADIPSCADTKRHGAAHLAGGVTWDRHPGLTSETLGGAIADGTVDRRRVQRRADADRRAVLRIEDDDPGGLGLAGCHLMRRWAEHQPWSSAVTADVDVLTAHPASAWRDY